MVSVGDGENACLLADRQKLKLKCELLETIGTTYNHLNEPIQAEAVCQLLNKGNSREERNAQSKILKSLLMQEISKGDFEEATLYFERLSPITEPENLLVTLAFLVRKYIKKYPAEKARTVAFLQKELPSLLKKLSKDNRVHFKEFLNPNVLFLLSLVCQIGEITQAHELMDQVIRAIMCIGPGARSFVAFCRYNIFSLLCEIGRGAEAQRMVIRSITELREECPQDRRFFKLLFEYKIFATLCKIGNFDKAIELLQSMPADVFVERFHFINKHNKALKELAQQWLILSMDIAQKMSFVMEKLGELEKPAVQAYMKSACKESVNKVLQILGLLVKDSYQQELIEMVQGWQPGESLDLALFTKEDSTSSSSIGSRRSSGSTDSSD